MIELRDISAKYKKKVVVNQVGFSLQEGAFGLLGPNGAGKTTLIRAMSGVLPYEGKMLLPESIGYLPQHFGMYNELTVSEAMSFFSLLRRLEVKEAASEIKRCLALANMEQYADMRIRKLSGGMLRRLGIAQALLGKPKLLLLDEPTVGLDPEERMRFKMMLNEVKADCTILLSTHIVEDVVDVCDGVMIMNKGKIITGEKGIVIPITAIEQDLETYYLSCIHNNE